MKSLKIDMRYASPDNIRPNSDLLKRARINFNKYNTQMIKGKKRTWKIKPKSSNKSSNNSTVKLIHGKNRIWKVITPTIIEGKKRTWKLYPFHSLKNKSHKKKRKYKKYTI